MQLQGRSAIVTGGAGGLGSAVVRHLAGLGMGVVVFDIAGDRAEALAKEIGDGARAVVGDAGDDETVEAAIEAARELGPFSLVANVGGGSGRRSDRRS